MRLVVQLKETAAAEVRNVNAEERDSLSPARHNDPATGLSRHEIPVAGSFWS